MANKKAQKETILGEDFRLTKKLGQGGMGAVYLGHQLSLDRPCAVKVLSKDLAAKPGFVERFLREARAMAKIDHPHVVSCYAVGEDRGHHFVAMELIDGQSMQDWLNELGQLSVPDALLVTIIAAEALDHAHELNMIHRDVKPDNLLVTRKGIVKVADMGLAKAIDDEDMSLTQSGTGLGTPHYMPPEQARNAKHVDRRCDVYALGCTLYHFLTGTTPFEGDSILELISNKEKGSYTPAKRLNPQVPDKLDLMIGKAMERNPQHRYQTCKDFITQLESLGLAGECLEFIDETDRTILRRGSASALGKTRVVKAAQTQVTIPPQTAVQRPTVVSPGPTQFVSEQSWFVRYESGRGKVKVAQMTTGQILQAMKTDKLPGNAKVSQKAKGPFLTLLQVPVFEEQARRMLVRQQSKSRDNQIAVQYEKLAKQYERRKWWQLFGRMLDGNDGIRRAADLVGGDLRYRSGIVLRGPARV